MSDRIVYVTDTKELVESHETEGYLITDNGDRLVVTVRSRAQESDYFGETDD